MVELTVVVALGFAFVLGVGDAANATAALVGTGAARYRPATAFSFVFHLLGGLLGGSAVAATILGVIHVPGPDLAAAYAAACLAAILFTVTSARLGFPTSASFGLAGGLAGAGLAAGGADALVLGGFHGLRPYGLVGVLVALFASPMVGLAAGATTRKVSDVALRRATRRLLTPVLAAIWGAAALVAFSDGTNDGQKAMGVIAGALVAEGSLSRFSIPTWARILVAVTLAAGTTVGGRRMIRTVGRGLYRQRALDGCAAQLGAAVSVLGAAAAGAPVSTSSVVAASVVGVGVERRRRHVRWSAVGRVVGAWVLTIPACALLGALAFPFARLLR